MSTITSTLPALLNIFIAPAADSPTVTWFGVGGCPGAGFRFDVFGCAASAGNRARYVGCDAPTGVTLLAMPVAVFGIVHPPLVPHTANVTVSWAANGVLRGPTSDAARVSASRHGTLGTNDDTVTALSASTAPASPTAVAVAAANAATTNKCTPRPRPRP